MDSENFLAGYLDSYYQAIVDIQLQTGSIAAEIGQSINILCAIGALLVLTHVLWNVWVKGNQIDITALLRPFLISLVVVLFPSLVNMMETMLGVVGAGTDRIRIESVHDTEAMLRQVKNMELTKGNSAPTHEPNPEQTDNVLQSAGAMFDSFSGEAFIARLQGWFQHIIIWLLETIRVLIAFGMKILSVFYRIFLAVVGPVMFTIAIFPGFGNTILSWFSRYIHAYMYIPLINIFEIVINRFSYIQLEQKVAAGDAFNSFDIGYMVLLAMGCAGYLVIPTLATWVVESGGGVFDKMKQNAGSAASGASAVASSSPVRAGASKVGEIASKLNPFRRG